MKKIILFLLSVTLAVSLVTITGCKKAQEEAPKTPVEEPATPEGTEPEATQPPVSEETPAKE